MKIAKVGLYGFGSAIGLLLWQQEGGALFMVQFLGLGLLAILYGIKVYKGTA